MRACSLVPNFITWNATISACAAGQQWQLALSFFEMVQGLPVEEEVMIHSVRHRGMSPLVISYGAALSACEQGSQWLFALRLLAGMQRRGLTPNLVTFNSTVNACSRAGCWAQVLRLLREMWQSCAFCDVVTYDSAIAACQRGGRCEVLYQLIVRLAHRTMWLLRWRCLRLWRRQHWQNHHGRSLLEESSMHVRATSNDSTDIDVIPSDDSFVAIGLQLLQQHTLNRCLSLERVFHCGVYMPVLSH